jgi:hypothetical protein
LFLKIRGIPAQRARHCGAKGQTLRQLRSTPRIGNVPGFVGVRAWPGGIMLTVMLAGITWQRDVHAHSSVSGSASPAPDTLPSNERGGLPRRLRSRGACAHSSASPSRRACGCFQRGLSRPNIRWPEEWSNSDYALDRHCLQIGSWQLHFFQAAEI